MSSLCCFRGLLSYLGVKSYPLDVVAQAKLDQAKKQKNYSSISEDKEEKNNNESAVNNNDSTKANTSISKHHRSGSKSTIKSTGSKKSTKNKNSKSKSKARSFDDSDSDSSSDSEEETLRHIRKSIRKANSLRSSRNTLTSTQYEQISDVGSEKRISTSSHDLSEDRSSDFMTSPNHEIHEEAKSSSSPSPVHQLSPSGSSLSRSGIYLGSEKQFQRKAIRKSPDRSRSSRSEQSLNASHRSSEWAIDDGDSLYREKNLSPEMKESSLNEIEMAQRASREAAGLAEDGDDDEFRAQSVEPISACGTLDVAVQYVMSEQKLHITIIEAHDLPSKARGGASIVQVRAVLLPTKKKRYKTKVQHIRSPRFAETFKLTRASPEDLRGLALRLRMYGIGKVKDRLIGEAVIKFDELNLIRDPQLTIQLQLEPRTNINRVDSDASLSQIDSRSSSMMSLSHGGSPPELLIGLSYNPPTGRLCVEVIKGSHFRNLAMTKPPDTFVKLSLLNSACQEMSQSKTTVRRGQPNPVYKETFYFQAALFQLGEVTLMVSVYNRRTIKRKEMIGWVSMGRNSSSEPDEQHWQEMKEGKGQQVCRWHTLIDT